ncbi:MAG: putative bifunctional diguanylate cyclase/phosphodiesterase [Jatrophihabitantaceae bacterium]
MATSRAQRNGRAAAGLVLLVCAFVAVLRLRVGGAFVGRAVDDLGQSGAAAIACVACAWRARRSEHRWRISWALMSAALGSWAAGELIWSYYELLSGRETPFPSFADVGFLLFPAFAFPALLVRPSAAFAGRGRLRAVLDGTMVAASLFVLGWSTSLGAAYHAGAADNFALVVSLAYPVSDVVMLTVIVLVSIRGRVRTDLLILAAGLVAMAVADSGFTCLTAAGTYHTGSFVDFAWFGGFLTMGASALFARRDDEVHEQGVDSPFNILLPYALVLVAVTAEVVDILRGSAAGVTLFVAGAALAVLLVRQFLVVLDNRRLALDVMAQREELSHRAFHDPLTGLANRALFYDRVAHALDLHHRDMRPVSVMFVDLDDFKLVNDEYGHDAGDVVLSTIADRLSTVVRTGDTIARLGGDEFAILLEDDGDASVLAARLLDAMTVPVLIGGRRIKVQASVGTTTLAPADGATDIRELLKQADLAMYAAKRAGKGTSVRYAPSLRRGGDEDHALCDALAEDIRCGRIAVAFAPIICCGTGEVFALEALATRWEHDGVRLLADRFVPLADRAGVLAELDLLVVRRALLRAKGERHRHFPMIVSTNLALTRFRESDIMTRLLLLLTEFDLPAEHLVVEVSEQSTLDIAHTAEALEALRAIGVKLALDGFGAGASNLSRLDTLRPDIVKLDRSFIEPLRERDTPRKLLAGVIDLAHDLGALVVCDGVETARQLAALRELGCDAAQGHLFARPALWPAGDDAFVPQRADAASA